MENTHFFFVLSWKFIKNTTEEKYKKKIYLFI
jgi:hypothetical protein